MFELKEYSRKELAVLYFPERSPRGAYLALRRWLEEKREKNPELLEELHARKTLPKTLVRQVVELLGEP